jgi:ureidoacrylate peracid hydrolase
MDTHPLLPAATGSALIVVDMQNGFVHEHGSCARSGFQVAPLAHSVAPCARAIALARAAGVPVVYSRYTFRADYRDGGFLLREKFPMLPHANAVVAGSWDQAILDELAPHPGDFVVDKNRPSTFYGTPLDSYLKGLDVDSVVVCGVTTNCSVESTVRDAAQRDFRTFVLADAVAEWDADRQAGALKTMGVLFAHLIDLERLEGAWAFSRGTEIGR